jgi:hypothetical protein
MGFSPQQVGEMSLWQFTMALDGFAEARGTKKRGMSDQDFDELSAMVDEAMA